jgi:hypothetical protein
MELVALIWVCQEGNCFFGTGWTGQITLTWLGKLTFSSNIRTRIEGRTTGGLSALYSPFSMFVRSLRAWTGSRSAMRRRCTAKHATLSNRQFDQLQMLHHQTEIAVVGKLPAGPATSPSSEQLVLPSASCFGFWKPSALPPSVRRRSRYWCAWPVLRCHVYRRVECSDTHNLDAIKDGYRFAPPILRSLPNRLRPCPIAATHSRTAALGRTSHLRCRTGGVHWRGAMSWRATGTCLQG